MNQKNTEVQIKPAKGRPMLTWVGKRPLRNVIAYPAQLVETYGTEKKTEELQSEFWQDWPVNYPKGGLLFHGDNKEVLAHLLANGFRGKVKLIYIDPPFDSGADYVRRISLRGSISKAKVDGEGYSLGEQIQYSDIWANDNYLQFMYERLILLKELLSDDGSFYLHCDSRRDFLLRCLAEEVFGSEFFRNEIIWKRTSAHSDSSFFGQVHDTILFLTKGSQPVWNPQKAKYEEWYTERYYRYKDQNGRRFKSGDLSAYGLSGGGYQYVWKGIDGYWRCPQKTMEKLDQEGRIYYTDNGIPRLKQYLDKVEGLPIQSLWDDIQPIVSWSTEGEEYPTQKPEALLDRIIQASSNPGDIVLDCFLGSGTTTFVAQALGRRWIGCDINKGAIQITSNRLRDIIDEQNRTKKTPRLVPLLPSDREKKEQLKPSQLSFTVFRINDYDLQIQHNEAVNLACEHIGITRTKTDAFFDGTLGKRLVKIIPFNHPLSPLDLEEIKKELTNRPEEERDIAVVCLGKELAVDAWIEDWNRLRKQGDFPNKIEVIELRSDPRYGGFFTHQPAQAQVKVHRTEKGIEVVIEAFISPTIIERLKQQAGLLAPQIDDWRAMVDSVMIDTAYDGQVFNVVLADVPEKKSDLVTGQYILPATEDSGAIAVKITDMLGEEVLVIHKG
jgi:adenine-specific DNA-methyltransferase